MISRTGPISLLIVATAALATTTAAARSDTTRADTALVSGAEPGPPEPVVMLPMFEGGVRKNRGLSMPLNLRLRPEAEFGLGYTASNSYLNPGQLVCMDRSCTLDYESDHSGNFVFAFGRVPVLRRFEIEFGTGSFMMGEIPGFSPAHQLASDSVLRSFHKNVLGEDSLATLSGAPDGRQVFSMTDLDGRRLRLRDGHAYRLPLRFGLTRYFDIRETARSRMGVNVGLYLSHPLEGDVDVAADETALARGMDAGLSVNVVNSRRVSPRVTSTFHLQVARLRSDVHVVNALSPRNADDLLRSQYALTYGLRFAGTFAGRAPCSFAMSQVTNSAHYDKDSYWAWDPLVFEGGNNLRGALAGANDYGVLSFACEHGDRQYQLAVVEDIGGFSQLFAHDGAGTSYDPDFTVNFAMTFRPGARRAARGE